MNKIYYRKGYKYQLAKIYKARTKIKPSRNIITPLIELKKSGLLIIKQFFAWDGCSGPTKDGKTNMRAGCEHDAFCQLMRRKKLARKWLKKVNKRFYRILLSDKMNRLRAFYYYKGGSIGSIGASKPKNVKRIYRAP